MQPEKVHDTFESHIAWQDEFVLGYLPMDETHAEFVDLVHAMQVVADGAFPAVLQRFMLHAERHFAQEECWMAADGYPARDCHVEEHAAVMKSVREVCEMVEAGNILVGRRMAHALEEWFPGHVSYMDSALAAWMVKQGTGGHPVVLRRKLNQAGMESVGDAV